jgi:hypothetical protein
VRSGESLSSWIARLAGGLEVRPGTLLSFAFGTKQIVARQDLDRHPPNEVLERLAFGASTSVETLKSATIARYASPFSRKSSGRFPKFIHS